MSEITRIHPGLASIMEAIPADAMSVVDIGVGRGAVGALCRMYRSCGRLVGVATQRDCLELCARHGLYDQLIERDLLRLPLPFEDGAFDVATCIDVLSHFGRDRGERLLDELERIAHTVIVTMPLGQADAGPGFDGPRRGDGLRIRDFRSRGYRVRGVGGVRALRRGARFLASGLGAVTRYLPELSDCVLCVRVGGPARRSVRDVAAAIRSRDPGRAGSTGEHGTAPLPAPATRSGYARRFS